MRKAEIRARQGRSLDSEIAMDSSEHSDLEPKEGVRLSIWNAIVPIGTLIIAALVAFYYSGYSAIMGGDDATLIQLFTDSPFTFTAIREASVSYTHLDVYKRQI